MDIPESVKIQGHVIRVRACTRRNEVTIGESFARMSDGFFKANEILSQANPEKAEEEYNSKMYELFEIALKMERKRIKKSV